MKNFDYKKYLSEGKLLKEEENRITRKEVMANIFKMVGDLEKKLGVKIFKSNLGNLVGIDVNIHRGHLWRGSKQIWIGQKYPTSKEIEKAYSSAKEWVDNFPEHYADYLSWKEKGKEDFNQEAERRKADQEKNSFGDKIYENKMDNFNYKKYLAKGKLLKEGNTKDDFLKLKDAFNSENIPSKIHFDKYGSIDVLLGFDYPDSLAKKVSTIADGLGITIDMMADMSAPSGDSISTTTNGGPQEWEREYGSDDDDY
jgi:hypothetical protein